MKINKIISEEINKTLNEGYTMQDERLVFNERLQNSSFSNFEGFSDNYDVDIVNSDINVKWKVSFWLNKMGIENFIIEVLELTGNYYIEFYHRQSGEVEQETEKNINEIEWKYIIDDVTLQNGGGLYVQSMNFDFKEHTCTLEF